MDREMIVTDSGVNESPADSLQKQGEQDARRDARGQFQPGKSENPHGRARGSRNRATLIAEALLDDRAEELVRLAIESARNGDAFALRLCVERIIAPRRVERVRFAMPPLARPEDAPKALAAIAAAVAKGDLAPGEVAALSALVDHFVHALETQELEHRLQAVEAAAARARLHA
jgi:hypothetical protein